MKYRLLTAAALIVPAIATAQPAPTLDAVFDRLADVVDAHFAPGVLPGLIAC